jgi:hypothetical protein
MPAARRLDAKERATLRIVVCDYVLNAYAETHPFLRRPLRGLAVADRRACSATRLRPGNKICGHPSWRWLVSSQAEGVFGPPVSVGRVGFMKPLP